MNRSYSLLLILLMVAGYSIDSMAQSATVSEVDMPMKTFMFSDPNPIPDISRIYPYYYFHGYTDKPKTQNWKMVVLENDYIKVFVCPQIGGKIWGAIEKSTGKEFLYFNHVVKFRDVAMRGAWTSGGLEYNFGDIGHIPTCATPVDYYTKKNDDGSVSCVVGARDLPSGSKWNVEIIVHPHKAFFETKARWFNSTSTPCTYYHWMNAAAKASGNLEFIYPGNRRIGHGGELGSWPNEGDRKINWYDNNDFGFYKSYHVINSFTDFFGGYWHDDNFGFGHCSTYDDKPGKKLWIWGLSDQGMIWEDLLTEKDGQYIEYQAGKLFNQAANSSTLTPFKHKEFAPHDADIMREIWFPLKGTKGMSAVSDYGVMNVKREGERLNIIFQALQPVEDDLKITCKGKVIKKISLDLAPMESQKIAMDGCKGDFNVVLGDNKLIYSSNTEDVIVDRPVNALPNFDWSSAYGLYTKALELEKQRRYNDALATYNTVIEKDPGFMPALNRIGLAHYRKMDYSLALEYTKKALSIDTYDGMANYLYGLVNDKLGNKSDAMSGFSISAASIEYRAASYTELAKLYLKEKDFAKVMHYTNKALSFGNNNSIAYKLQTIALRNMNRNSEAHESLEKLFDLDATCHMTRFESYLLNPETSNRDKFVTNITNEFPFESYLDLAIEYNSLGCNSEANEVLKLAPDHPLVWLWRAAVDTARTSDHLSRLLKASPYLVFPHRNETAQLLSDLSKKTNHWKLNYYLGLIKWNQGLLSEAKTLFVRCGDEPDYAPFYIARAKLSTDSSDQLKDLKKACNIDPGDWRASLELSNYYLTQNKPAKALEISSKLQRRFPLQSSVGLNYAQSLIKTGDYRKAASFLSSYNMLPFEGATVSRDLYHEACIRVAFENIKNKSYKNAIIWANKARQWPINLGVGRPYEVDERLEDYVVAFCNMEMGKVTKASAFMKKVAHYIHPSGIEENTKLYLQLLALKSLKNDDSILSLSSAMAKAYPTNEYIKWAIARFNYDDNSTQIRNRIIKSGTEIQPYDTKFIDKEFSLMMDFVELLDNRN